MIVSVWVYDTQRKMAVRFPLESTNIQEVSASRSNNQMCISTHTIDPI